MKKFLVLAALATLGAVSYRIVAGGGCGSAGALACPDPALEHGAGQVSLTV